MKKQITNDDLMQLQKNVSGVEKKTLPHLLCTTNMILYGIEIGCGLLSVAVEFAKVVENAPIFLCSRHHVFIRDFILFLRCHT